MKNQLSRRLLVLSTLGLLALGGSVHADTPTIQLTPKQRAQLKPKAPGVPLKAPLKLPPMVNLASATLSIYQTPVDTWCRNHPAGTASGRVFVQITFPQPSGLPASYANLVVNTGSGEARSRIRLGTGRFSAGTAVLNFAAPEICSDHCVRVRLEPEGTPSGYMVNTAARQACMP